MPMQQTLYELNHFSSPGTPDPLTFTSSWSSDPAASLSQGLALQEYASISDVWGARNQIQNSEYAR